MIESSYTDAAPRPTVPEYPYLVKKHSLVLFVTGKGQEDDELKGFVIATNGSYPLGQFSTRWNKDEFARFDGSITLHNKREF